MSSKFPHYLKTHRKRLGLSQADVAHLLGAQGGAKVCRYERFARTPSLEAAIAYEVIFRRPCKELFSGLYQRIEHEIAMRAKALDQKKEQCKKPKTARQRKVLAAIITPHQSSL